MPPSVLVVWNGRFRFFVSVLLYDFSSLCPFISYSTQPGNSDGSLDRQNKLHRVSCGSKFCLLSFASSSLHTSLIFLSVCCCGRVSMHVGARGGCWGSARRGFEELCDEEGRVSVVLQVLFRFVMAICLRFMSISCTQFILPPTFPPSVFSPILSLLLPFHVSTLLHQPILSLPPILHVLSLP